MISSEKEVVPVKNPVDPNAARGNVELWLVEVEATWRLAVTVSQPDQQKPWVLWLGLY